MMHVFGDPALFWLGPIPITRTMVTTTFVSGALVGLAVWLRNAIRHDPTSLPGVVAGACLQAIDQLVVEILGRPEPRLTAFSGALFLFIAACNLAGQLPGVEAPTASLSTTSALAIVVFFAVPFVGVRTHGFLGYFKHYLQPNPLLFPIHVISELSRTLALAVRLFGNVMSGELVVALLVVLGGFLVPTPMMALDLLIGLLQAYIFAILTTVYVGAALRAGEE